MGLIIHILVGGRRRGQGGYGTNARKKERTAIIDHFACPGGGHPHHPYFFKGKGRTLKICKAASGGQSGAQFHLSRFGWQKGQFIRLQRQGGSRQYLGHLVSPVQG